MSVFGRVVYMGQTLNDQARDEHGRFAKDDSGQSYGYRSWTSDKGSKVELRRSTVRKQGKKLGMDVKQVAVVDLNGKEHKAFSVKGEGGHKSKELADKVVKHMDKHFGIDAKPEYPEHYS